MRAKASRGTFIAAAALLATVFAAGCRSVPHTARTDGAPDQTEVGFLLRGLSPRAVHPAHDGPGNRAKEEAALEKAGVPVTAAEMYRAVGTTPARLNAAADYARLGEEFKKYPGLDAADFKVTDSTAQQRTAVRRMLSEHANVMVLIRRAASKPRCQFKRHWEFPEAYSFPESLTFDRAARMLAMESALRAMQGRYYDAIREQALGFSVAGQEGSEPDLIAYLAGQECESTALEGMKSILLIAGPRARVDLQVRAAVAGDRPRLDHSRAYWGQVLFLIEITDMLKKEPAAASYLMSPEEHSPPPRLSSAKQWTPKQRTLFGEFMDENLARSLGWNRMAYRVARQPTYLRRIALSRRLGAGDEATDRQPVSASLPNILPGTFLRPPTWEKDADMCADAGVTDAGAAVLAYRARHGRYPDRLDQAAPRTADPFTGGPLHYKQSGAGFIIYSVGRDREFNGRVTPTANPRLYFHYPAGQMSR